MPEAELAFKVAGQDEVTSVGVRQCRQREESGQGLSLQPQCEQVREPRKNSGRLGKKGPVRRETGQRAEQVGVLGRCPPRQR